MLWYKRRIPGSSYLSSSTSRLAPRRNSDGSSSIAKRTASAACAKRLYPIGCRLDFRLRAGVRRLADHVIARHYPEAVDAANRYRTLLDLVISRHAALIAKWQLVGFIHGVMNTDNMSMAGETIDYGPCAFMDVYHPETVYSSIDSMGRYAYGNQPRIAQWNLARLAETLLPLLAEDKDAAVKE